MRYGKCMAHVQEGAVIASGLYPREMERELQLYIKR